ncbi:MAG TPA: type II secretion system protein [Fimbriimonadaceae bacterium]|nr:type II secretion system protein [Fimbriimonadaceae bacterium]
MKRYRIGFTLLELLVVIAILAILASILFPAFAQGREAAKKGVCLQYQRQLSMGLLMYTDEYEGVFPGYVQDTWIGQGDSTPIWVGMVQPYMKSREVHLCPSAPGSMFGTTWGTRSRLSIGLNINYGLWIYGGRPLRAVASDMEHPSRTVLLGDGTPGDLGAGYRGYLTSAWNHSVGACGQPVELDGPMATVSTRHRGGTNLTFADGHGRWYPARRILPDRDPRPGDWCMCVADANPARVKWLATWRCSTDGD